MCGRSNPVDCEAGPGVTNDVDDGVLYHDVLLGRFEQSGADASQAVVHLASGQHDGPGRTRPPPCSLSFPRR